MEDTINALRYVVQEMTTDRTFPYTRDCSNLHDMSTLDNPRDVIESAMRLIGTIGEQYLCSVEKCVWLPEEEKLTIKEILDQCNIEAKVKVNSKPDAWALSQGGELILYEFSHRRSGNREKEEMDRQKWAWLTAPKIIISRCVRIIRLENVKHQKLLSSLRRLTRDALKLVSPDEATNFETLFQDELNVIRHKDTYETSWSREKVNRVKSKVYEKFPELELTQESAFSDVGLNQLLGEIQCIVKEKIKKKETFYEQVDFCSIEKQRRRMFNHALSNARSDVVLKKFNKFNCSIGSSLTRWFDENEEYVRRLNKARKEIGLIKHYNYCMIDLIDTTEEDCSDVLIGCSDQIFYKKDMIAEFYRLNKLKRTNKNISINFDRLRDIKNSVNMRCTIIDDAAKVELMKISTKLQTAFHKSAEDSSSTNPGAPAIESSGTRGTSSKGITEAEMLKLVRERDNYITNILSDQSLQNSIEEIALCTMRSTHNTFRQKNAIMSYQKQGDTVLFYNFLGNKSKAFVHNSESLQLFKCHPSRMAPLMFLTNAIKIFATYSAELSGVDFQKLMLHAFIGQNKITQCNLQNIRYIMMACSSEFISRTLWKKVSPKILKPEHCYDLFIMNKSFGCKIGETPFFNQPDSPQQDLQQKLSLSYLCNLITKDTPESEWANISCQKKYLETKLGYDDCDIWKLNEDNKTSVEEFFDDVKCPTISPRFLKTCLEFSKQKLTHFFTSSEDRFRQTNIHEICNPHSTFQLHRSDNSLTYEKSKVENLLEKIARITKYEDDNHSKRNHGLDHAMQDRTTKKGTNTCSSQAMQDSSANQGDEDSELNNVDTETREFYVELKEFITNTYGEEVLDDVKLKDTQDIVQDIIHDDLEYYSSICVDKLIKSCSLSFTKSMLEHVKDQISKDQDILSMWTVVFQYFKQVKQSLAKESGGKKRNMVSKLKKQLNMSSRASTSVEVMRLIKEKKEKGENLKRQNLLSELTCEDYFDIDSQYIYGLSNKEQVGGSRELYVGNIHSKVETRIAEDFARELTKRSFNSCLNNHETEVNIQNIIKQEQTNQIELEKCVYDYIVSDWSNEDEIYPIQPPIYGSLDHSKWGPCHMPAIFAQMIATLNEELISNHDTEINLIEAIIWKHCLKKVEVHPDYIKYLVKNKNPSLKTSLNDNHDKSTLDEIDELMYDKLKHGCLGFMEHQWDMGQGILHNISDIYGEITEDFINYCLKLSFPDIRIKYCTTSDDQVDVVNTSSEMTHEIIETHRLLSLMLNKKVSEKSVWSRTIAEFKSVFIAEGSICPPTIKFIAPIFFMPNAGDPITLCETCDSLIQSYFDNAGTISICNELNAVLKRMLGMIGFTKEHRSLIEGSFDSYDAFMLNDMSYNERKLYHFRRNDPNYKLFQKYFDKIDNLLLKHANTDEMFIDLKILINKAKKEVSELGVEMEKAIKTTPLRKHGEIRIVTGRRLENKENMLCSLFDPLRDIEDNTLRRICIYLRDKHKSSNYETLEQAISDSISQALRRQDSGDSFLTLSKTCGSKCIKNSEGKLVTIKDYIESSKETIFDDYTQLALMQILKEKSVNVDAVIETPILFSSSPACTMVELGDTIEDDITVSAMKYLHENDEELFKKLLKSYLPGALWKSRCPTKQDKKRFEILKHCELNMSSIFQEARIVFRMVSPEASPVYHQGDRKSDMTCTSITSRKHIQMTLGKLKSELVVRSFIEPVQLDHALISDMWTEECSRLNTNPSNLRDVRVTDALDLIFKEVYLNRSEPNVSLISTYLKLTLGEVKVWKFGDIKSVEKEIVIGGKPCVFKMKYNISTKTYKMLVCSDYLNTVIPMPEDVKEEMMRVAEISEDVCVGWELRSLGRATVYDRLQSKLMIDRGCIGELGLGEDGQTLIRPISHIILDRECMMSALYEFDPEYLLDKLMQSKAYKSNVFFMGLTDVKSAVSSKLRSAESIKIYLIEKISEVGTLEYVKKLNSLIGSFFYRLNNQENLISKSGRIYYGIAANQTTTPGAKLFMKCGRRFSDQPPIDLDAEEIDDSEFGEDEGMEW